MFFPLVVLVAVLPGLYALSRWDLSPPGPWWGLRGLAVLDGHVFDQTQIAAESPQTAGSIGFRAVLNQPPLYAWLEAIALRFSFDLNLTATVLPSYIAGAALLILVYLSGRLWRGPGVGVVAAILTGFNHALMVEVQQASPTTCAIAGAVLSLYAYGRHLRAGALSWSWDGGIVWVILGGLGLGCSLMSLGLFGLIVVPIVALHQFYLRAGMPPGEKSDHWWLAWRENTSLIGGGLVLLIGLGLALPWHVMMARSHGSDFLLSLISQPGIPGRTVPGLLSRLVDLAPATLALGMFAAVSAVRDALLADVDDSETIGGSLWVVWLAAAALAPTFWPTVSSPAVDLFLLIPLNLLAAEGIADLADRRIPIRVLNGIAPATAVCVAWWLSANLREGVAELMRGRAGSSTGLGLHLALDLIIGVVLLTRWVERWARRRDDRQRKVLAIFLVTILGITLADGLSHVTFRHKETRELLSLRDAILRRDFDRPLKRVAVIGPDAPHRAFEAGRLRFILKSSLPKVVPIHVETTEALIQRFETQPKSDWLVILIATDQRLSYPVQSSLGLEAIYPGGSGSLEAFASAKTPRD